MTRAVVRGQALQSSDKLLTLHLLQLPRFRWELREGNGTRSRRCRERRECCSTRGRARPGPGVRPSLCKQPGRPVGSPEDRLCLCTSHHHRGVRHHPGEGRARGEVEPDHSWRLILFWLVFLVFFSTFI